MSDRKLIWFSNSREIDYNIENESATARNSLNAFVANGKIVTRKVFLDGVDISRWCFGIYIYSDGAIEAHCYQHDGETFVMNESRNKVLQEVVSGKITTDPPLPI